MRSLVWVVVLVALPSCGPRYIWVKDVSQDELNRDRYECERDARMSVGSFGTGFVGAANAEDFIGRCFQAKGYHRQQVGDTQNEPGSDWYANNLRLCNQSCAANNLGEACYGRCRANWQK